MLRFIYEPNKTQYIPTCGLEIDRHGVRLSIEAKHPTKPGHVEGDGADVDDVLLLVLVAAVHEKGFVFQAGGPPCAALQNARKTQAIGWLGGVLHCNVFARFL